MKYFLQLINTKKIMIIALMTILLLIILCLLIFIRAKFYDFNLFLENYTPQNVIVTKDNLLHDINIMQHKDGVNAEIHILSNKKNVDSITASVFYDRNGNVMDGTLIHMGVSNRIFTDSRKPIELRFVMRIMLYLQAHKFDSETEEIIGISGGFMRDAFQKPNGEGDQPFKMSVEDFNKLYKEANVSSLDTEKQIDTLADLWVKKTGYWRRGLNGQEIRPVN